MTVFWTQTKLFRKSRYHVTNSKETIWLLSSQVNYLAIQFTLGLSKSIVNIRTGNAIPYHK